MPTICVNCSIAIENKPHRQCDCCKKNIHLSCTGLQPDDRLTRGKLKCIKIVCNSCAANIEQFADIKQALDAMRLEMTSRFQAFENKISSLEAKFDTNGTAPSASQKEDIVREAVERIGRSKNIILRGVPEINGTVDERKHHDSRVLSKVLGAVGCSSTPLSVIRLGKPQPDGRPRALRAVFPDSNPAKQILRNKAKLLDDRQFRGYKLHDDKTKSQLDYLDGLRRELQGRVDAGEAALTIKYIKGIPQIVESNAKK